MILVRMAMAILMSQAAAGAAFAQGAADAAPVEPGARYIFATFGLILGGVGALFVVMGLALRHCGHARVRNRATSMVKAAFVAAIAFIVTWAAGFNLAFNIEPGGLLGSIAAIAPSDEAQVAADPAARLFFHATLAMLVAVIPLGAAAERARFWPHCLFSFVFVGLTFPIVASWVWGGGYLSATWAFADLAGGAVIHVTGGAAALAAAMILGPRGVRVRPEADLSGVPLAGLGGFLASSGFIVLLLSAAGPVQTTDDAAVHGRIAMNALLAASVSLATALALTKSIYRKIDASAALNGLIGAMAALSAAPASPAVWQAALIGGIAGVLVTLGGPALERAGVDDPAGAIPAHLVCGAFGLLILPWYQEGASVVGQAAGLVMIAAFAFILSALVLVALRYTIGLRIGPETEQAGLDQAYLTAAAHRAADLK